MNYKLLVIVACFSRFKLARTLFSKYFITYRLRPSTSLSIAGMKCLLLES
jgi:hypothetical protein